MITYIPQTIIDQVGIPKVFTFPFFYEPHPLTIYAAKELQTYIEKEFTEQHNFGLEENNDDLPIGKMFGVLIVRDADGKIGYLSAHSGKLAGKNVHERFVPPVYDMLQENSFFLKKVEVINTINAEITLLEQSAFHQQAIIDLEQAEQTAQVEIESFRATMRDNRAQRKQRRTTEKTLLSAEDFALLDDEMNRRSIYDKKLLAQLISKWDEQLQQLKSEFEGWATQLSTLKEQRKTLSADLQQQIFEQYAFLNQYGENKSLYDIFKETIYGKPPVAAGECATPKLLQYAFIHGLQPIAMGEFWWGASPKSEVRKHKHYYPACTGKCEPILKHMLIGIDMDENPFLVSQSSGKSIEIVYEDDCLVVVNKPENMLSVPGINVQDSVMSRLKAMWGNKEPIVIHRLDMATSGLMVVAKTLEAHKFIQRQFINKKVTKRYTALLHGRLEENEGKVDLPLRGNLDDLPRQMVCFEHGKRSLTKWKVVERTETKTRIHFWPLTGRSHQLRMHAAHSLGLNMPIVGDDLYGITADRLHLHAAYLSFIHPISKEIVSFERVETF